MKKISFFNHGHNGDMHTSKEYIRQIQNTLQDFEFEYCHANHIKTISDLEIFSNQNIPYKKTIRFVEGPNHLVINTWNGAYSEYFNPNTPPYFYFGGTNYPSLTDIWEFIFNKINEHFSTDLKIKSPEEYFPTINFKFFNVENIKTFVKKYQQKKVLVCNGPVRSKQSFIGPMKEEIQHLAVTHPNYLFICTHRFDSKNKNIMFTDDIIKDTSGCDLNEISYLSTFCDVIIGKNSGPFVFCMTKENFLNKDKVIISFNKGSHDPKYDPNSGVDSLPWGLSIPARYIFENNVDGKNIIDIIQKNI